MGPESISMVAPLIPALGAALLAFLWQGALIGASAALLLWLLRGHRPQVRYAVACVALAACLWLPVQGTLRGLAEADATSLRAPPDRPSAMTPQPAAPGDTAMTSSANPLRSLRSVATMQTAAALPWIVALWAAGVGAMLLRMLAGLHWLHRLRRDATPANAAWQARLHTLAQALGMGARRRVALLICDSSEDGPFAAGLLRPVVVMPAALLLRMPADLLEALIAHELAHIRRHDYLVNLLQGVVEALLFYHPAVWWLSRRIRIERELVADDLAATATGAPRRLALALAELDRHRASASAPAPTPAPALAAHGGLLMSRIQHLIRPGRSGGRAQLVLPALTLLAVGVACYAYAGPQPAAGGTPQPAAAADRAAQAAAAKHADAAHAADTAALAAQEQDAAHLAAHFKAHNAAHTAAHTAHVNAAAEARARAAQAVQAAHASTADAASASRRAVQAVSASHHSDTRSGAGAHPPYAIVRRDENASRYHGSSDLDAGLNAARRDIAGDFLWFQRDGRDWVVRDAEVLARVERAWAAIRPVEAKMQAKGAQMQEYGKRMEAIAQEMRSHSADAASQARMQAYGAEVQRAAQRQAELALRQAELVRTQGQQKDAGTRAEQLALERELAAAEREVERASRRLEAEGEAMAARMAPMEAIGKRMEAAGAPMEALGKEMEQLGVELERIAAVADRAARSEIDRAVQQGKAEPAPTTQRN